MSELPSVSPEVLEALATADHDHHDHGHHDHGHHHHHGESCGCGPAPYRRPERPGRNEPCHCGSGRKYKKCCLRADEAAA